MSQDLWQASRYSMSAVGGSCSTDSRMAAATSGALRRAGTRSSSKIPKRGRSARTACSMARSWQLVVEIHWRSCVSVWCGWDRLKAFQSTFLPATRFANPARISSVGRTHL